MRKLTLLGALAGLVVIGLTAGPDLWAAPGQTAERQTVPTRTPTAESDTPEPTDEPGQEPTDEPGQEPTDEPQPEPTDEPEPEPTSPPQLTNTPPRPTPTAAEEVITFTPTSSPTIEATSTVTPMVAATATASPTAVLPTATGTSTPVSASPTPEELEGGEASPTASPTETAQPAEDGGGGVSPFFLVGLGLVVVGLIVLVVWKWRR